MELFPIVSYCSISIEDILSPNPLLMYSAYVKDRFNVKMPIADWLPYPLSLYIHIGFGLSEILSVSLSEKSQLKILRSEKLPAIRAWFGASLRLGFYMEFKIRNRYD